MDHGRGKGRVQVVDSPLHTVDNRKNPRWLPGQDGEETVDICEDSLWSGRSDPAVRSQLRDVLGKISDTLVKAVSLCLTPQSV